MNKPHCWLEVRPERSPEQPRVLLVSVPYALKAADADTINSLENPRPQEGGIYTNGERSFSISR
jgi:hypothetical protein